MINPQPDLTLYESPPQNTEDMYIYSKNQVFSEGHFYYYCKRCQGWIRGEPTQVFEDDAGILSGRQGVREHCLRCGNEIAFHGAIF